MPSIVSANRSADRERGEQHEQAVDRIVDGQHPDRAGYQVWNELHVTAEHQRDELADDDAEPPGCKDSVERAPIEGADDEQFSDAAENGADESDGQACPRDQPKLDGDDSAIGADGQPGAMGEIDDLEHAENGPRSNAAPRENP